MLSVRSGPNAGRFQRTSALVRRVAEASWRLLRVLENTHHLEFQAAGTEPVGRAKPGSADPILEAQRKKVTRSRILAPVHLKYRREEGTRMAVR